VHYKQNLQKYQFSLLMVVLKSSVIFDLDGLKGNYINIWMVLLMNRYKSFYKLFSSIFNLLGSTNKPRQDHYTEVSQPKVEVNYDRSKAVLDHVGKDAWVDWPEETRAVSVNLFISYKDKNLNKTERNIRTTGYNDEVINAYCEMRNSRRTFIIESIKACVDLKTGEEVEDVYLHLDKLYKSSPQYTLDSLIENYPETMRVLTYVARSDGQFRKNEKEVICNFFSELTGDKNLTVDMVGDALNEFESQTLTSFKRSAGYAFRSENIDIDKYISCCHLIVNTQKNISAGEEEALLYLEKLHAKVLKEKAKLETSPQ